MKRSSAVLCAFVSLWLNSSAQITFHKSYQDDLQAWGHSFLKVDSGFLMYGNLDSSVYLVRTDQYGDTLWTKKFGRISQPFYSRSIIRPTNDGGYVLAVFRDTANPTGGVLMVKFDEQFIVKWSRFFVNNIFYPEDLKQTSDLGYILVGTTGGLGNGLDICLIKTDSLGNFSWANYYGAQDTDQGLNVEQTVEGGYIILCQTNWFNSNRGLIKTDANGVVLWSKGFGNVPDPYVGKSLVATTDTNYVLFNSGASGFSFIKVDTLGSVLWTKSFSRYGPNAGMAGYCIQQTSDDGFIISGNASQILLLKTDNNGDTLWVKRYQGHNYDVAFQVDETIDGGYILACSYETDTLNSIVKAGLMKTDANGILGCFEEPFPLRADTFNFGSVNYNFTATPIAFNSLPTSVSINSGSELIIHCSGISGITSEEKHVEEIKICPNPVDTYFKISNVSGAEITLFNFIGKVIVSRRILEDNESINCENLQPGIYFVQVQSKNETKVQKLIKE